jgi:hypothetical protein
MEPGFHDYWCRGGGGKDKEGEIDMKSSGKKTKG